jgi:hypothetical protein
MLKKMMLSLLLMSEMENQSIQKISILINLLLPHSNKEILHTKIKAYQKVLIQVS